MVYCSKGGECEVLTSFEGESVYVRRQTIFTPSPVVQVNFFELDASLHLVLVSDQSKVFRLVPSFLCEGLEWL